jgi:hypothetical protein
MQGFSGSSQGKTRRLGVTTFKSTPCFSTAGLDLARRDGQCGLHRHDQNSSYVDFSFFLPDASGVDVISTSQELGDQGYDMARGRRDRGQGASRGGRAVCADSEALERGAGYGDGGGLIVKELGYLALAITLAALYVAATPRL